MQGRANARDIPLLMIMPVAAALSYTAVWSFDPGESAVQGIFTTLSIGQVVTGAVAYGWAARRSLQQREQVLSSV